MDPFDTIPGYDDDTPSILPSYQMHQAILAKTINIPLDSNEVIPSYESINFDEEDDESLCSTITQPETITPVSTSAFSASSITSASPPAFDDGLKILDLHRELNKSTSESCIKMSVHLTSTATNGNASASAAATATTSYIDPSKHEYTSNDVVSGYIIAENTSSIEIPYTMFYIFLEGNINSHNILNGKVNNVENFLQIIDLAATSSELTAIEERGIYAPIRHNAKNNVLQPGMKYKKNFQFKIPQSLLDSNCKHSPIESHMELPGSIPAPSKTTKNLTFQNISVSYDVHAKCISPDPETNLYNILQEVQCGIRVVPQTKKGLNGNNTKLEKLYKKFQVKYAYNELIERVGEYIEKGKELRGLILPRETPAVKYDHNAGDLNLKSKHLYDLEDKSFQKSTTYTKKKSGILSSKVEDIGKLSVAIPVKEHVVAYIPPREIRSGAPVDSKKLNSWSVDVPISMSFTKEAGSHSFPELKSVNAALCTYSVASTIQHIPIEFDHDMIFSNSDSTVNFNGKVTEKFKSLSRELTEQCRALKREVESYSYPVDGKLLDDIKCLGDLRTKNIELPIRNVELSSTGDKKMSWKEDSESKFVQDFNVHLDLTSATSEAIRSAQPSVEGNSFDSYCLVPSFQNCSMARLYYIDLKLEFSNGKEIGCKLPVTIEN